MHISTVALLLTGAALTTARGLPRANELLGVDGGVFRRANCDVVPAAKNYGRGVAKPITTLAGSAVADSATDCQAHCEGDPECRSFLFGTDLERSVACLLFAVPVSEIPKQRKGVDLKAYDRSCTEVSEKQLELRSNRGRK